MLTIGIEGLIISNFFSVNLYNVGLGEKIKSFFSQMITGQD
jgi:hypothetical protein